MGSMMRFQHGASCISEHTFWDIQMERHSGEPPSWGKRMAARAALL